MPSDNKEIEVIDFSQKIIENTQTELPIEPVKTRKLYFKKAAATPKENIVVPKEAVIDSEFLINNIVTETISTDNNITESVVTDNVTAEPEIIAAKMPDLISEDGLSFSILRSRLN